MSHSAREEAKAKYAKSKYVPKDLRVKKTRAIRRALTPFEASRKTVRQQKKAVNYKIRKYALKA